MYTPYNWQDGVTLGNQTRMNALESQYTEATNSFEQDLFSAFIYSGLTCAKDGSIANQLDISSGVAFLRQTDSTLRRRAVSSTSKTTSTPSTTYYLYVQPDGSLYWSTSNSPATNSLAICQVTTDTSGNISTVTDERQLNTHLLTNAAGSVEFAPGQIFVGPVNTTSSNQVLFSSDVDSHSGKAWSVYGMQDGSLMFYEWTVGKNALQLYPDGHISVGGQAAAGSFGVPVIVAQALDTHVTTTGVQYLVIYSVPTTGIYRISGWFHFGNSTTPQNVTMDVQYTDPHAGTGTAFFLSGEDPPRAFNAKIVSASPFGMVLVPLTVRAQVGTTIYVHYNDAGGTPNDYVSAVVERLA